MADNHGDLRVYMAKLNEYCQRNNLRLEYPDVDATGPPHDRIFTVAVEIDKRQYSQGKGKSKKEARQHAAALAWGIIEQEKQAVLAGLASKTQGQPLPPPSPPLPSQASLPAANLPESPRNYILLLNEYTLKNKKVVQYTLESKDGPPHVPVFSYSCKIDGEVLGMGTGNNKQTAKLNAAKLAYEKLTDQTTSGIEKNATPTNSSTNSLSCNFHESPKEACLKSVQEAMDVAPDTSDSIVFQNTNGSECKGMTDKLTDQMGGMHVNETSSSSPASLKGPAVKHKRLAANFSMPHQNGNRHTVNERFLEDFQDIERLGSGGYGNVFKAKNKTDNKIYAVKRVKLTDGKEEKTKKEVKALANLDNKNIVRYFGCWTGEDIFSSGDSMSESRSGQAGLHNCLFICMDYCEMGTLANWIDEKKGEESYNEDVLMKFQQIVNGVEYIHEKNYIHRDLKPLNIFISRDNEIKIGDFGLVTSGIDEQRTQSKGTRMYMAPEQVWSNYGKEVDIFSLGLILFEMLSAFKTAHQKAEVMWKAKEGELPVTFIETFPREAALIKKLLSKEPSKRPTANVISELLKKNTYNPHTC